MALRLQAGGYSTFEQIENVHWVAYLYGPGTGTVTMPTDESIFTKRYDASSVDINTKIIPSSLTLNVYGFSTSQAQDLEDLFTEISEADEGDFILKVYKNTQLDWVGFVLSDQIVFSDDKLPKSFSIRAVCGLAKLKEVEFNKNTTEFEPGTWEPISKMLTIALKKTGLFAELSPGLKASTGWTCAQNTYASFLEGIRLNHVVWLFIDGKGETATTNNRKSKTAWQVLEEICTLFHARLVMSKGSYWFIQLTQYLAPLTATVHSFDENGNVIGTTSGLPVTYSNEFIQAIGADWRFEPAIKKVRAIYKHSSANNVQLNLNFLTSTITIEDIESFDGTAKAFISFILSYPTVLNPTQFPTYQSHIHKFAITIRFGDKWLKRTASIILGQIVYTDPVWVNTGADYEFFVYPNFGPNGVNRYNFNLITPPIPADGTATLTLRYVFTHFISNNTSPVLNPFDWSASNGNFQVLPQGLIDQAFNTTEYSQETSAVKATKIVDVTTSIGDGPFSHTLTTMKARAGEGNVQPITQSWTGAGVTGSVHQVLAASIVKFSGKSAKKINIPFISGGFDAHGMLESDDIFFVLLSGDYDAKQNTWVGTFIQVADNPNGISLPPKKYLSSPPKIGDIEPPIPIPYFPTIPDDGKLDLPEVKKSDITALRTGLIPVVTTEPIEVGSVDQIKINPLDQDKVFLVGDKVIVTDVKTGVPTVFTVAQNTVPGDDIIHVQTQTITDRIVDGSYTYLDPEYLYTRGVLALSNLGAGIAVYKGMNGKTAEFKTLIAGSNITISQTATEVTIAFSGTIFTSFSIAADSGTANTIVSGETLSILGGTALSSQVGTNQITLNLNLPELLSAAAASGDYLAIYDISTGTHARITIQDILNLVPSGFTSFSIGADTGSQNSITNGETFFVSGGGGLRTVVSTNQISIFLNFDAGLFAASPASGDYIPIYDISAGTHARITIQDILNLVPGGFTSFSIGADTGSQNSITNGETFFVSGGGGLRTVVTTNQITIFLNFDSGLFAASPASGDYIPIFDISANSHARITIQDILNLVPTGFTSFTISANGGTANSITNGETLNFGGGTGISTIANTNQINIHLDILELSSVSPATGDYLPLYDLSTGLIGKISIQDILNLVPGGFSSFTIAGDSGTPNTITNAETLTITGGVGLSSQVATNQAILNLDVNSLSAISPATNDKLPIYDTSTGGHGSITVQDILNLVPPASGTAQLGNFVKTTNASGEHTEPITGVVFGVIATYWESGTIPPGTVSVKSFNSSSVTFVFRDFAGNLMANTTVGCIWVKVV